MVGSEVLVCARSPCSLSFTPVKDAASSIYPKRTEMNDGFGVAFKPGSLRVFSNLLAEYLLNIA